VRSHFLRCPFFEAGLRGRLAYFSGRLVVYCFQDVEMPDRMTEALSEHDLNLRTGGLCLALFDRSDESFE
jgi:hypothetical protein